MALSSYDSGMNYAAYSRLTYPTSSAGSGSILVKVGYGKFSGVMVTAVGNTPTLFVYDSSTGTIVGGTPILASFTPVAGTQYYMGVPILFKDGLFVGSTGSVGCTIAYF
jgi:hypothetical protein